MSSGLDVLSSGRFRQICQLPGSSWSREFLDVVPRASIFGPDAFLVGQSGPRLFQVLQV